MGSAWRLRALLRALLRGALSGPLCDRFVRAGFSVSFSPFFAMA
jgi:hypothetical protein